MYSFVRKTIPWFPSMCWYRFNRIIGPDVVDRFNVFPAAKILGNPAPGVSSGQAIAAIQQVVSETLSSDYSIGWTGSAYQEIQTAGTGSTGFLFGLLQCS